MSWGPGADRLGVDDQWLDQYRVTGSAGSVHLVPLATGRPDHGWLLGTGDGTTAHWRAAGAALVRAGAARLEAHANGQVARHVQVHLPPGITPHQVASLALGCVAGSHRYRVTSQPTSFRRIEIVTLIAPPGEQWEPLAEAVSRAQLLGQATGLARDLANTPSGPKDPAWLTGTAARLASTVPGLRAIVRDER